MVNFCENNLGDQVYGIYHSQYHEFTGDTESS